MTAITPEELALIHEYSRRELTAEEVYVFPLTLCDNETDRDGERFSIPALEKLAGMFLGKTGIFDHNPKASNQTARIYKTEVVTDEARVTFAGEPYTKLTAWAYMVRDERNAGIIRDIDAGILKEVSVGVKAAVKDGVIDDPADAYEWSFVAVPAQKAAGVTKTYRGDPLQAAGMRFLESLQRDVARLAGLTHPGIDPKVLEAVTKKLDIAELEELKGAFLKSASKAYPLALQLGGADTRRNTDPDSQFKI